MADEAGAGSDGAMREALDRQLADDLALELLEALDDDDMPATEADRLQRVDAMLKRAPHQRAPARLAATILARLAQQVEAEAKLADMPPETQKLLMLYMSACMMAMMPMMEAASWLVLNARRDPELLGEAVLHTIGFMSLVTDALIVLLQDAEDLARTEPQLATATLALTPYMLSSVLDQLDEMVGSR